MRTFIGLFCVLALSVVTVGCGAPAEEAPPAEPAPAETTEAPEVVEEETAVVEETPVEEATEEPAPEEEAAPEEVVETMQTEARPSLLLEIMLEPVADAINSQTSNLPIPGM